MASKRLRALAGGAQDQPKMDMSPLIDMVFLLLVFFMVTSRLIDIRQDRSVQPSVALDSQPLTVDPSRIVINVLQNGAIKDSSGNLLNLTDVENLCRTRGERHRQSGYLTKLHLRADRRLDMREIGKVIEASTNAGVTSFEFATYPVNPY